MRTLAAPSLVQSPTRQILTTTTNFTCATLLAGGKLIAVSTGAQPQVWMWTSPFNLSAATKTNIGSTGNLLHSSAYDPSRNCVYIGTLLVGSPRQATIFAYDLGSGAVTTVINGTSLGVSPSTQTEHAIATDGTYIYLTIYCNAVNSYLFKLRISDGALITTIQMPTCPNTFVSGEGSFIGFLNATTLVVGGAFVGGWVALVPTDLSTVTTLVNPGTVAVTYQISVAVIGGNVWVADATPNTIRKLPPDLSSVTSYTLGGADEVAGRGIAQGLDGNVWALDFGGNVTVVDPTSGTILAVHTELTHAVPTTGQAPYTLIPLSGAYLVVTNDPGTGSTGSTVALVPTGDATVPARELGLGS